MAFNNDHLGSVLAAAILVALTGYGQTHDRKEAEQAGFEHYLVKPTE